MQLSWNIRQRCITANVAISQKRAEIAQIHSDWDYQLHHIFDVPILPVPTASPTLPSGLPTVPLNVLILYGYTLTLAFNRQPVSLLLSVLYGPKLVLSGWLWCPKN